MSGTECSIFGTLIPWRASVAAYKLANFLMMVFLMTVFARSEAPGELHVHQN
jgi:hypothetical protein